MEGIWERLEAYARTYLPWWRYERDGREPEAALLTVLGSLLEDAAEGLERLPEKHEREFLRAFGLERREARPALAWAVLSAPRSGTVPAGTQFYLSGDGDRPWRTQREARTGPCRLVYQVFAGGESGKLIPAPPPGPDAPVRLFDFRLPGAQRREARFSHPDAFASRRGSAAALVFAGEPGELLDFLADGASASWSLEGDGAELPLDAPRREGGKLIFTLPPAPEGGALLVWVADGAVPPAEPVGEVWVEARREDLSPETVLTEDGIQGEGTFLPFGEEPGPWRTCCLDCGDALSLRGAELTLAWTASLGSLERLLPGTGQAQPLRAVMRRLPPEPPEVREVYAAAVAWEYWDGGGWRPIPGAERYAGVFGPLEDGPTRLEARFPWPRDAGRCTLQGREAFWLRWRVRAAEGWDAMPRRSRPPEVTELRFSADLCGAPVKVERRTGLEEGFSPAQAGRPLFPAPEERGDAWWLGFAPPPEGEALDLWLALEGRTPGGSLTAWEATPSHGERPLALEDGTGGLGHSGAVSLRGIRGEPCLRFGRTLWWLCLRDETGTIAAGGAPPVLTALDPGAVLLRSERDGACAPGDPLRPLRGGTVSGRTRTGGFGGSRPETEDRALVRTRDLRRYLGRGMSACDIDLLLRDAIPDVARTRCVRTGDVMEVGVLLRDAAWHSAAFGLRRGEISRILERETVLPALGLEIAVREPDFYAVHTSVWLSPPEGAGPAGLEQAAREALTRFLHPVSGGPEGRGWPMGTIPPAEELKALVRSALPGTEVVELLSAAAAPDGRELEAGAVRDPFALPVSGVHTISILKGGTI